MWAGFRSEFAYFSGFLRVLKATKAATAVPSKTIGDHLREWAQRYGDRPALADDTQAYSYAELDARANAYARWALEQGFGKGDAVALMMPNRPEYMAIWFGLTRVGVAVALVNIYLIGDSLAHSFAAVKARAVIVEASLMETFATARDKVDDGLRLWAYGETDSGGSRLDLAVAELSTAPLSAGQRPAIEINDTALYVYTSGTTGLPKAARITHSRVLRAMFGFGAAIRGGATDRAYLCLPMYHFNGGVLGPGMVLPYGGSAYIRERFSASGFWRDVIRENCTLFIYIGEMCRYLLNAPPSPNDKAHKLRACMGNGLRPDIFAEFQARFGVAAVLEFYAATEGNAAMINLDSRPGAVGRVPTWGRSRFPMEVVAFDHEANTQTRDADGHCIRCLPGEAGELIAEILDDPSKPAARFDGYADAAATRQKVLRDVFAPGDAWFRTGDLLRRDELGYFYFVDRIGDTFRWKGENVSTTEVAETLAMYPGVIEAAVYGVAVPNHDGRAGMAALVVESMEKFDLPSLRAFLAEQLPAFARPQFLRFRTELDTTSTFRARKMDLVADGFDPARTADPVYYDDRNAGAYVRVGETLIAGLNAGEIRL